MKIMNEELNSVLKALRKSNPKSAKFLAYAQKLTDEIANVAADKQHKTLTLDELNTIEGKTVRWYGAEEKDEYFQLVMDETAQVLNKRTKNPSGDEEMMEKQFCTKCGTPLRKGAKFCVKCGIPVRSFDDGKIHPSES